MTLTDIGHCWPGGLITRLVRVLAEVLVASVFVWFAFCKHPTYWESTYHQQTAHGLMWQMVNLLIKGFLLTKHR